MSTRPLSVLSPASRTAMPSRRPTAAARPQPARSAATPLTITSAKAPPLYADINPAFTGTTAGLKNIDATTATHRSRATAPTPRSSDPIVPAAVDSAPSTLRNYLVTLLNGTLTVNQTPL